MGDHIYQLLVIGGGINGAGIAMDAAGRGLDVALCEMNDLGSATSSRSSKLIHGGLRYLEHYQFRLVREALAEREVLLTMAPHIIWPLRFRLPHQPQLRPSWLIRAGLFLYDHLSRRNTLPASYAVPLATGNPLKHHVQRCYEYSDGWVDDARLVILNAMAARDKGATILPRTRCIKATRVQNYWQVLLEDSNSGQQYSVQCSALVNAAGPWVSQVFKQALEQPPPRQIRLVKGSHIVVPRLHQQPHAYILQNDDRRIVFAIPYEDDFTLIGTTDVDYRGDPACVTISQAEIEYLINTSNRYFSQQLNHKDIIHSYAGVRPLLDSTAGHAQAASRDYYLALDNPPQQAPLLSVFGGKITTYRKLAQTAVDKLASHFPQAGPAWTEHSHLPGGDFSSQQVLQQQLHDRFPWLPIPVLQRYVRSYGTLCTNFLDGCESVEDMGATFGAGLFTCEVRWLQQYEWARTTEDILWRRSKLGLRLTTQQEQTLARFLASSQPV